jgi:hypothetical protein
MMAEGYSRHTTCATFFTGRIQLGRVAFVAILRPVLARDINLDEAIGRKQWRTGKRDCAG